MKKENIKTQELIKVENFVDSKQLLKIEDETFKKLMFIYSVAIKEMQNKLEILKKEFEILYNYDLIDHIDTRIKTPDSIIKKMEHRNLKLTYKNMIENINDIAGVRVVCPLKKDIFDIKNLIQNVRDVNVLKEKDYVTYPKKSGYSSYHMVIEIPVMLSQNDIYAKLEVQIRTVAMDFWSNLEHKVKYKPEAELISKKQSAEWVNCAKMIRKLDNKMMRNVGIKYHKQKVQDDIKSCTFLYYLLPFA